MSTGQDGHTSHARDEGDRDAHRSDGHSSRGRRGFRGDGIVDLEAAANRAGAADVLGEWRDAMRRRNRL